MDTPDYGCGDGGGNGDCLCRAGGAAHADLHAAFSPEPQDGEGQRAGEENQWHGNLRQPEHPVQRQDGNDYGREAVCGGAGIR